MKTCIILVALLIGGSAQAQTLIGLKSECGVGIKNKPCKGFYQIRNDSLKPMVFSVTSNKIAFSSKEQGPLSFGLAPGTEVKLSETSGRLSPRETRQIDFTVKCAQVPCVISLATSMTNTSHAKDDGVNVRMVLAHFVYVCQEQKNCRLETLRAANVTPPEQRP